MIRECTEETGVGTLKMCKFEKIEQWNLGIELSKDEGLLLVRSPMNRKDDELYFINYYVNLHAISKLISLFLFLSLLLG